MVVRSSDVFGRGHGLERSVPTWSTIVRLEIRARLGEALVAAMGIVVMVHELSFLGCLRVPFPGADTARPVWLLLFAGAAGAALALGNWTAKPVHRRPELTSVLAFAGAAAVLLVKPELFVLACASGLAAHGLLGLASGRIAIRGKAGTTKLYVGAPAYFVALIFLMGGTALILVDVMVLSGSRIRGRSPFDTGLVVLKCRQ